MKGLRAGLLAVAGFSIAFLGGCSGEPSSGVLWVVLHGVRADHSSTYGYERETTPNLSRLADEGVLFENAYATSNDIRLSLAEMLTGHYTSEFRRTDPETFFLRRKTGTVGQDLKAVEFFTGAFYAGLEEPSSLGLAAGFERTDEPEADEAFGEALAWLGERKPDGRWLLFVQIGSSTHPYVAPGLFRNLYADCSPFAFDGLAVQPMMADRVWDGAVHPAFPVVQTHDRAGNPLTPPRLARLLERVSKQLDSTPIPPSEVERLVGCYDATVAYADLMLGQLLAELEDQRLTESTTIVVVGDYGQDLLDHGVVRAVNAPYASAFHVPLILAGNGWPSGGRVQEPVSTIDLRATVNDAVGRNEETGGRRSLHPRLRDFDGEVVFAEEVAGHLIARDARFHLIWDRRFPREGGVLEGIGESSLGGGAFELFEFIGGAESRVDWRAATPEQLSAAEGLRAELLAWREGVIAALAAAQVE